MTMLATKVKLAVTDPITVVTLAVTECVEVEGNFGPQARITGTDDGGAVLTLYEKLDTVNRQLGRCGLDIDSAVGQRLAFWKETASNKAGQTFPALRIEANGAAPKAAAPRPAATTKAPMALGGPMPWEEKETGAAPATKAVPIVPQTNGPEALTVLTARYSACLQAARGIAVAQQVDVLTGDIAGAVTAIAATLFIQLSRQTER
jgi:hypothetical protein